MSRPKGVIVGACSGVTITVCSDEGLASHVVLQFAHCRAVQAAALTETASIRRMMPGSCSRL
jgi:hypothetical protein